MTTTASDGCGGSHKANFLSENFSKGMIHIISTFCPLQLQYNKGSIMPIQPFMLICPEMCGDIQNNFKVANNIL